MLAIRQGPDSCLISTIQFSTSISIYFEIVLIISFFIDSVVLGLHPILSVTRRICNLSLAILPDLLLLNNSSSHIGSALHSPRIASMQNLIPHMALTYAQLISPIQCPDLPELLPLKNIIIFTIVDLSSQKTLAILISCSMKMCLHNSCWCILHSLFIILWIK